MRLDALHPRSPRPLRRHALLTLLSLLLCTALAHAGPPTLVPHDRALHPISPLLFGQFLEDTMAEEEGGVEAAVDPQTRTLRPDVQVLMEHLKPSLLRYPGGAKVIYSDWTNFVDHAPQDGWANPALHSKLGIDRFVALARKIGAEPLLVVNFRQALMKERPLDECAQRAAGLVAYCNAAVGEPLPPGMPDWPALRARNGSREPYRIRHFQIGNEMWIFNGPMRDKLGAGYDAWHVRCLQALIEAMRRVDPSIQIVTDAMSPQAAALMRSQLGDTLDYITMHQYRPWAIDVARKDGFAVPGEKLSPQDVWNALVAMPRMDPEQGCSTIDLTEAREPHGYKVAVTEWNYNGWACETAGKFPLNCAWMRAVGAAGYMHALMRANVQLATQSMMVGTTWDITAIRVDPAGKKAPYIMPSGEMLAFYNRYHGNRLIALDGRDMPTYAQPFQMGLLEPCPKVATLDTLATADDQAVYLHVINRDFQQPQQVTLDLGELSGVSHAATLHVLRGELDDCRCAASHPTCEETRAEVPMPTKNVAVTFPPRSVACLIIPRHIASAAR